MIDINDKRVRSIISSKADPEVVNNIINDPYGILDDHGINTPQRKLHFIAQMSHESAGFRSMVELRSDSSAERKYGVGTRVGRILGNTQPGDGGKYKGRGYIQLTGRYNYTNYGNKLGINLVDNPELASDPEIALQVAAKYWEDKGLNRLADNNDIKGITKRINGGYNGLQDRIYRYNQIKDLF